MNSPPTDDKREITPPFVAGLYVIFGWGFLVAMLGLGMMIPLLIIFGIERIVGVSVPDGWDIVALPAGMFIWYYLTNWLVGKINKILPEKWLLLSPSDLCDTRKAKNE